MILLTRRTLVVMAALAPVALLGYITPAALDVLAGLNAVVLGLALIDARLAVHPRRLRVARQAPLSFTIGRDVQAGYRWENDTSRPARFDVREVRPELLGGVQPARRISVAASAAVTDTITITPGARGRETTGWFAIRSIGPMGLGQRSAKLGVPWTVTVYPHLPASRLRSSIAEAVRRNEAGLRPHRRLGEGRQFESLREWVSGDDTRHIDWKATARRQKVIARQFEEERRQQMMLVLDAGRLLTADLAGTPRFEHVVRAALWLAFAGNHHDDNVGVMVFSDDVHHYVMPQRGRRGLRQVLDVLAVAKPRMVEPDYPAAFRYLAVRNRKRALTVFFTDVIDRLASEAVVANVASLRPRHLPLIVTLRNPALDEAATLRPVAPDGAYRKAAAEELLARRHAALSQMRASGALVLDTHPEKASWATVQQYLELKRRGQL